MSRLPGRDLNGSVVSEITSFMGLFMGLYVFFLVFGSGFIPPNSVATLMGSYGNS